MKARLLPSGNYNVVVPFYDEFGKRLQRSFTAATEAKALKMARDFIEGRNNTTPDDTITVKEAMMGYINYQKVKIQPTTVRTYTQIANNAFRRLHRIRLCDLSPFDIRNAIIIENERVSPKYIKNAYGLLKSVLKMYEVDIKLNNIALPPVVRKEKELPDFATIFNIFHRDEIELPVLLAAWLSLRIGEVAGLQFQDVDEEQKMLHIRRTVIMTENGSILRVGCKTKNSTRTLPLPPYILELIKAIPHENDTDQILQITPKALRSRFKRRVLKHGIDMTFHDLRHVNASIMHMLGVPDKYAMERGGWSTDYTLKNVYQQTFSSERLKQDEKIDNYFNDVVNKEGVEQSEDDS